MSVGTVVALGSGLYNVYVRRGRYGTKWQTTASGQPMWFIFRNKLVRISHTSFAPGATRYFKLQPYTAMQDYDLATAASFSYVIPIPPSPAPPALTPGPQSFSGTLNVALSIAGAYQPRYTVDGTPVHDRSPIWPQSSGGAYTTLALTQSAMVRVRGYAVLDDSTTPEATFVYTQVASASPGAAACGLATIEFSGRQGQTAGTITLRCATVSSTIKYSQNGAAYVTYSAPFTIALGDTVETYATATGFTDSLHSFFDNEYVRPQGGTPPSGGPGPGRQEP